MAEVVKKLPIGIESFEKIRRDGFYYVDKTGLIKELLENWGEANLFTRPRRFGKSLNMSMLQSFFELGCDPQLFDGLSISKDNGLCKEYMGKFPVVFVSLKDIDASDYKTARGMLIKVVNQEARRLQYLLDSEKLSIYDKKIFAALLEQELDDETLYFSLRELTELLNKHFCRKAILLIDEYDVPLSKADEQGYYEEMTLLIRNMFEQVLKTNDSLFFAVLTGCLRVAKESIFTGLNNLKVHTISDLRYDEYFGFTDADVDELLESYGLSSCKDTIRDWYDGYRFGDTDVYCPWDVINYCDELLAAPRTPPKNYWANTSGNDLIRRLLKEADLTTKDEVEELLNGGQITKQLKQELTYREIDDSIENVWSVLYATGYLTGRNVEGDDADLFRLWIPNGEIQKLFYELVKDWFRKMTRSDISRINRFCAAFTAGDTDTIREMLNAYLWESISVRDTAVRRNMKENFYHGMLLGLLQNQRGWMVKSNVETGEGYSDISILTVDRLGIVIELKYADDRNLAKACREALKQIEEKKYAEGLKRRRVIKIMKYGIAFYEKECMVAMA